MDQRDYDRFTERIKMGVTRNSSVLGLADLSPAGDKHEHSDHHFCIVTAPGAQADFLETTEWVPTHDHILLESGRSPGRRSPGHRTLLFKDGHQLHLVVVDAQGLSQERIGPYHLLYDRAGVGRLMASVAAKTQDQIGDLTGRLETLCVCLNTMRRRSEGGDQISAERWLQLAVDEAIVMLGHGSNPDDRRSGLEDKDPTLADAIGDALALPTLVAGQKIFKLVEDRLRASTPSLAWTAADEVATLLDSTFQARPTPHEPGHLVSLENSESHALPEPGCPMCGADDWTTGRLYKKGSLEETRFLATGAPRLSLKRELLVRVCEECGHAEMTVLPRS